MPDYSLLSSSLEFLVVLAVSSFILVWFYKAVRRIEDSLKLIEKRLESLEGQSKQTASVPPMNPTSPSPKEARERISNAWAIPAVLFIVGALGGYSLLGGPLTAYVFEAAGVTAVAALLWEVIRRARP